MKLIKEYSAEQESQGENKEMQARSDAQPIMPVFDDVAWAMFFDVIGERHPAIDLARVRDEVQILRSAVDTLSKDRDFERFHRVAAEGEVQRLHGELSSVSMAVDYYRAGSSGIKPKYVPCRVRIHDVAMGDHPFQGTCAPAGDYDCTANPYGAVSITATNGQQLGLRLSEFEPIAWALNSKA